MSLNVIRPCLGGGTETYMITIIMLCNLKNTYSYFFHLIITILVKYQHVHFAVKKLKVERS